MGLELGLQLYSVRQALQNDAVKTLEQVAEIGYRHLELAIHKIEAEYSVGGLNAAELKRHLGRLGMDTVSCHAMVQENDNLEDLFDFLEAVGSPTFVVPMGIFSNREEVLSFSDRLNRYGEAARKRGIDFYYHNHFQEFQVFEGEKILDTILNNTDPDLVKIELDTYWTVRGGEDPIHWLHKLGKRCDLIHQKDLPASATPVNYFDLYGADTQITMDIMYKTQIPEQFTESGEGILDITGYIDTIRSLGHPKYIFVEQDMTSRGELESIAISYRNMTKLLSEG